jgi:cell wall-associated NlpC family hydrolase
VRARAFGTIALVVGFCAGCGQQQPQQPQQPVNGNGNRSQQQTSPGQTALHGHPQAIEPVAGAGGQSDQASGGSAGPAVVSVGPSNGPLPQPVSDAEIRRELAASGLTASSSQAMLTGGGLAISPVGAPAAVQEVIQAGNQIAHLPYVWGGGHGRFVDTGYDCSGSISFVFAAAGILNTTMTSGELANWGAPGPGKWITVFANNGHTFMYIAGLRFDTVALAQTGSRWSNRPPTEDLKAFAVRHPPGL